MAKLLTEAGGSVFSKDRWGNTPLDEGQMCRNKNILDFWKTQRHLNYPNFLITLKRLQTTTKEVHSVSISPMGSQGQQKTGLVMWVPHSIEELINVASKQLGLPDVLCILSGGGGKIFEVDMDCGWPKVVHD
ncbi:hypothetical protein Pfo_007991 [Paulownia fortunei]|nr:hypothetical protein Pfo_007991 [Paulownia fortunei]